MFQIERQSLRDALKRPSRPWRDVAVSAAVFAAQVVACVAILTALYDHEKWQGLLWANVTAIVALQPGYAQSFGAAIVRVAANTIGAVVGLAASFLPGNAEVRTLAALLVVVLVSEAARLDSAVRFACVATVIVLNVNDGHALSNSVERFTATLIGCATALAVQLLGDVPKRLLHRRTDQG